MHFFIVTGRKKKKTKTLKVKNNEKTEKKRNTIAHIDGYRLADCFFL